VGASGIGATGISSSLRAVGSSASNVESTWMYCRIACWIGGISDAVASTSARARTTS
jgi:hypothetical protein